jgi:hypothetical protein
MKPIIASKRRVSLTATVLAPLVLALATLAGCVNVRVPDIPQIPRIPDIPGGRTDGAVVSELGFGTLVITDGRRLKGWWRVEEDRNIYEMHEAPTTRSGQPNGRERTIQLIPGRDVVGFERN